MQNSQRLRLWLGRKLISEIPKRVLSCFNDALVFMPPRRNELTDVEWGIIALLLPNKPRDVPQVAHRRVINRTLWRFRTGSAVQICSGPLTGCDAQFITCGNKKTFPHCPVKQTDRVSMPWIDKNKPTKKAEKLYLGGAALLMACFIAATVYIAKQIAR